MHSFISICSRLFAYALSLSLITAVISVNAVAQANLSPNQITGTIQFTNSKPEVLEILDVQGLNQACLRANSVGITPTLSNKTCPSTNDPLSVDYELTVESSPDGLKYQVDVRVFLDYGGDQYLFGVQESPAVYPEPAPNVVENYSQCLGILDVKWIDDFGNESTLAGGRIRAFRETSPGSDIFEFQAQEGSIAQNSTQEYLAVHGDGSKYRVDTMIQAGSDPSSDTIRSQCTAFVNVGCDEIVPVVCQIPRAGEELGEIRGKIDMLGEDEHGVNGMTVIHAFGGPFQNSRYTSLNGSPSQGSFALVNLVPSNAVEPNLGYGVYGQMIFRKGYSTQFFSTPWIYNPENAEVEVPQGQTKDLGDTFVIDPGYISGEVVLAGPPIESGSSCLGDIFRDADKDKNADGIPDSYLIPNTYILAKGSRTIAPGASRNTVGGLARTSFIGELNEESSEFNGSYELVLGGLNKEPSMWQSNYLGVTFINDTLDAALYKNNWLQVMNLNTAEQLVQPGQTNTVDHKYCMSEVRVNYHTTSGQFYNPSATANGEFSGADYENNQASYYIAAGALGTPRTSAEASDNGEVTICMPQGTYTLTPKIDVLNPSGGTSNTELRPITFDVGCRQIIDLSPELQLNLDDTPKETITPTISLSGIVQGTNSVQEIVVSQNSLPDTTLCTDCGLNPSFTAEINLEPGANQIIVSARDSIGLTASTRVTVVYKAPIKIERCVDMMVEGIAEQNGANVDFSILATAGCDGAPVTSCSPQSSSVFAIGETTVTCVASDSCGSTAECSFKLFVTDPPEPEPEPTPEPEEEEEICRDGIITLCHRNGGRKHHGHGHGHTKHKHHKMTYDRSHHAKKSHSHTIRVGRQALKGHLKHGDTFGACEVDSSKHRKKKKYKRSRRNHCPWGVCSNKVVTVCHRSSAKHNDMHPIEVSWSSLKAHLAHGDTLGYCPKKPKRKRKYRKNVRQKHKHSHPHSSRHEK